MKTLKLFAVTDKVNADGLVMTGTAYTAGAYKNPKGLIPS